MRRVEAQELNLNTEGLKKYSESDFKVWVGVNDTYLVRLAGDVVFETRNIDEIQKFFENL